MAASAQTIRLDGLSVLVTGGSRGLGREMALAVAEAGANVMISGRTDTAELRQTVTDLNEAGGGTVHWQAADVSDGADCERLVEAAIDAFGKLDVLVNNAGLGMRHISETFNTEPALFWQTPPDRWRTIIDTNLNGPFYLARAAAPHMIEQGGGKIINVSTSAQTMVRTGYAPYGPGKAGLEAASRVWAQDLDGTGVTVNVYLPGGASDTGFIPGDKNRTGADGNLLPAAIMQRGIGWLCSSRSDGVTGKRFTARLWDETMPQDEAARSAMSPNCDVPSIM